MCGSIIISTNVALLLCLKLSNAALYPVYQWNEIDFKYPSPEERDEDVQNGVFIPKNCLPMDVDAYYTRNTKSPKRQTFITIPRLLNGVPATLGTVSGAKNTLNPPISPYPDWSWHRNPERCNANRIVSVVRVQVDKCRRLWVLDSGRVNDKLICAPQILIFNLDDNQLIKKYQIPSEQLEPQSLLVTIAVETGNCKLLCTKTFAYIADSRANALIVYNFAREQSWRIKHKSFQPIPGFENITIEGESFELNDGLLGLALGSPDKSTTYLYYNPLASNVLSRVKTAHLQDKTIFTNNTSSSLKIFETFPYTKSTQSGPAAISSKQVMFFASMGDTSIKSWAVSSDLSENNVHTFVKNAETLQYPGGLKIVKRPKRGDELYVLSNRSQKFSRTMKPDEINFRIQFTSCA